MRTYVAKGAEAEALKIGSQWFVMDASNQVLGRLATKAARILIGKDKASFTPYLDSGDHLVIINADKIRLTGNKVDQKIYYSHSGYPGGLKEVPAKRLRESKPEWMVREAILGMLPKNKLRARRAKKLRVYRDAAGLARHAGQKPQPISP
ncbi:MAG: 50S ribosomal protein L13 [Candidatus Acidiferrum sp.]|jgi:large subunit ribosomal protein L13